jgi:hypothetical protein
MAGSLGSPFSHQEKKMSWTYGEVMAALGDEAQPVPGGILVFRDKHIMVGLCHGGGGFDVTPEGLDILSEFEEPVAVPRKTKVKVEHKAKVEPKVKVEPEFEELPSLDEVNLGD